MNHAAPGRRQADHLAHPIGGDFLHLGKRRAGLPGQAQHAQAGAGEIAEHAPKQAIGGEVTEEARMLPVREAGQDDTVQIADHSLERLGVRRRHGRKLSAHLARVRFAPSPESDPREPGNRRSNPPTGGRPGEILQGSYFHHLTGRAGGWASKPATRFGGVLKTQLQQLLDGDPRFVQNLAQSPRTDLLVIRNDDTGIRVGAP